jgi:uncharacterized membrane protein
VRFTGGRVLDRFFQVLGYGLCHQLPERSFFSGGYQLPVCARDTGIYLGFVFGLAVAAWVVRGRRPSELPRWPVLVLVGLFVAAMGMDGVTSYAGLRETTNDLRLLTGLMTGWGLSLVTLPMLNSQLWATAGRDRVLRDSRDITLWLLGLPAAFVIAKFALPLTGLVYPLLLAACIWATFGAVNVVFVTLLPFFERRAERLRDAWMVFLIAQVLTALELGAAAWLRSAAERLLLS